MFDVAFEGHLFDVFLCVCALLTCSFVLLVCWFVCRFDDVLELFVCVIVGLCCLFGRLFVCVFVVWCVRLFVCLFVSLLTSSF